MDDSTKVLTPHKETSMSSKSGHGTNLTPAMRATNAVAAAINAVTALVLAVRPLCPLLDLAFYFSQ